jgi:hypothetical protein
MITVGAITVASFSAARFLLSRIFYGTIMSSMPMSGSRKTAILRSGRQLTDTCG